MTAFSIENFDAQDPANETAIRDGLMLAHAGSWPDLEPDTAKALVEDEIDTELTNLRRWRAQVVQVRDAAGPLAMAAWYPSRDQDSEDAAQINMVASRVDFRRQGFGKRVIIAAEDQIKSNGKKRAELSSNGRAVTFYERLGYEIDTPKVRDNSLLKPMFKLL